MEANEKKTGGTLKKNPSVLTSGILKVLKYLFLIVIIVISIGQRKCCLVPIIIFFFEFRLRDIPLFDRINWFLKFHNCFLHSSNCHVHRHSVNVTFSVLIEVLLYQLIRQSQIIPSQRLLSDSP
jgi:cytochrome b subunit of formate dehydrogenase